MDAKWGGHVTHYVVTETPETEIQAWVEAKKAEQNLIHHRLGDGEIPLRAFV